jgi:serine/threonine-protein kinase
MTRRVAPRDRAGPTASGRLSVRTNPYSEVYEGGRKIGETPFADLELSPGAHVLTFKNPSHPTTQKTIVVVAGKAQKLSFDLP